MGNKENYVIEMLNITKEFPGIKANDNVTLQLKTDLKVGQRVKEDTILAYDKKSFSNRVGDGSQVAYNLGCITKLAIMTSEDGFEDSGIASEWLSEAMASNIVVSKLSNACGSPLSNIQYPI